MVGFISNKRNLPPFIISKVKTNRFRRNKEEPTGSLMRYVGVKGKLSHSMLT